MSKTYVIVIKIKKGNLIISICYCIFISIADPRLPIYISSKESKVKIFSVQYPIILGFTFEFSIIRQLLTKRFWHFYTKVVIPLITVFFVPSATDGRSTILTAAMWDDDDAFLHFEIVWNDSDFLIKVFYGH